MIRWLEKKILTWINVDRYLPLQLDITNACNLRCVHCYHPHHLNSGALKLPDWLALLDQYQAFIQKMHFRPRVIICGGEPITSPLLFPLLKKIRIQFPEAQISILTNGTLIHPGFAIELKKVGNVKIQISLDGPDPTRHDVVRGQGSFDRTKAGAKILFDHGIPFHLLAVLSRNSTPWISDFFNTAHKWNAGAMNFTRLIAEGHGETLVKAGQDRPLKGLDLKSAYLEIQRQAVRHQLSTSAHSPLKVLLHPALGRSGRFAEGIVIDYRGQMLASSRSRIVLGNPLREGLENIFLDHPLLKSIRSGKVDGCGECPLYRRCGGDRNAAYAETGNYLAKDPGCWLGLIRTSPEQKEGSTVCA